MGKRYLFNVYTFCKSLCVINEGSPYGLHGDPIYILYLYDHLWLVGCRVMSAAGECFGSVVVPHVLVGVFFQFGE